MNTLKYISFFVFSCMVITTTVATADEADTKKASFTLTKGKNNPVCKAYAERLKTSDFTTNYGHFPQCNRPENDTVEGFSQLTRTPLTVDEIARLWDQVKSFISTRDSQWYSEHPGYSSWDVTTRTSIIERFKIDDEIKAKNNWPYGFFDNTENRPYRIDSPVDIDNDGMPDNIVIWRDPQQHCGHSYENINSNRPLFEQMYALVLDDQGNIDDQKTSRVFGSSIENTGLMYKNKITGDVTVIKNHHFPITYSPGILQYQNQTYFDGFYAWWHPYKGKEDPKLNKKLGLLVNKQGMTKVVCELSWSGQE